MFERYCFVQILRTRYRFNFLIKLYNFLNNLSNEKLKKHWNKLKRKTWAAARPPVKVGLTSLLHTKQPKIKTAWRRGKNGGLINEPRSSFTSFIDKGTFIEHVTQPKEMENCVSGQFRSHVKKCVKPARWECKKFRYVFYERSSIL